uniref:Protoporphyrinogen oxidase n=1 Tax=Nothoprocta perdicaria TaxID=30464 RepID=A0A8C6Z1T1_NOTPE
MPRTVAVVGGGISGLAACYHLARGPGAPKVRAGGFGDPAAAVPAVLLGRARGAVRAQLGLEAAPSRAIVKVHQACIPQYTLGHWQRTESISRYVTERRLPLSLVGASYGGVSVNDCIASAKVAASRILGPSC